MDPSKIVAVVGGTIGAVGGILGFVTWWQAQRDRGRERTGERGYQAFVATVEESLRAGPGNARTVSAEQHGWAARAVDERRLQWGPDGKSVMLPNTYSESE